MFCSWNDRRKRNSSARLAGCGKNIGSIGFYRSDGQVTNIPLQFFLEGESYGQTKGESHSEPVHGLYSDDCKNGRTRNKKLLGAFGIATRSKDATGNKKLLVSGQVEADSWNPQTSGDEGRSWWSVSCWFYFSTWRSPTESWFRFVPNSEAHLWLSKITRLELIVPSDACSTSRAY